MRRFWSDRKGNVAVLFAFAIVPVIGALGAAVDYSMANSYRTDLQKSLDSAALALTKIMPADEATLQAVGKQYFEASMNADALSKLTPWVLTVTPDTGTIVVSVTGTYKPTLISLLNIESFEIGASAMAKWGIGKVEVALALDNTGSMQGTKIAELKKAAKNLITILKNSAKNEGDALVSLVPFATQVKLEASHRNETWLDFDSNNEKNNWQGCIEDRLKDYENNNNKTVVVDYDVKDTTPASGNTQANKRTKFPGTTSCGNLVRVIPLTSNWSSLETRIDQMTADGNTNVTIGLAWAWHTLSPTQTFAGGTPKAYDTKDLQKYIILLTDGDNTENRWGNNNNGRIDDRTELACANVKAIVGGDNPSEPGAKLPGIKIFTIRLIDGNASLLRNCATETSMYYSVQNADQLSSVFNSIGAEIANLHLAK